MKFEDLKLCHRAPGDLLFKNSIKCREEHPFNEVVSTKLAQSWLLDNQEAVKGESLKGESSYSLITCTSSQSSIIIKVFINSVCLLQGIYTKIFLKSTTPKASFKKDLPLLTKKCWSTFTPSQLKVALKLMNTWLNSFSGAIIFIFEIFDKKSSAFCGEIYWIALFVSPKLVLNRFIFSGLKSTFVIVSSKITEIEIFLFLVFQVRLDHSHTRLFFFLTCFNFLWKTLLAITKLFNFSSKFEILSQKFLKVLTMFCAV